MPCGFYACHGRIPEVDFARELDEVRTLLTQRGFRVAVIGGVALAAYGNPRLTLDLDVVTDAAAQDALVEMMEALRLDRVNIEEARGYFVRAGLEEKWHELAREL